LGLISKTFGYFSNMGKNIYKYLNNTPTLITYVITTIHGLKKKIQIDKLIILINCRNLNLGLATKIRACKGEGQKGSPRVTFHVLGSARECEGMNPHTPKWTLTLGVGISMDS
jgi:hypothetical protein